MPTKPTPTKLKVLKGNPGHRPLNHAEPKPPERSPDCPPHLKGEARKEWKRIVADLSAAGMITTLDRAGLTLYCTAWARVVQATNEIAKTRPVVPSPKGYLMTNPYLSIYNAAAKQLQSAMEVFGLSPSARTRIHIDKSGANAEDAEYFD